MSNRGVNKTILLGRVGQEPKVGALPNGSAACNFSLATSEVWKDKQTGEKQERTEWHKITVFGKLAEIAGNYVKKGSMIYVEGKLRTRKWNKDGVDHYVTEIIADDIQFTGSGGGNATQSDDDDWSGDKQRDNDQFDDDIPF
jgi:single-strand DNA-binding protein